MVGLFGTYKCPETREALTVPRMYRYQQYHLWYLQGTCRTVGFARVYSGSLFQLATVPPENCTEDMAVAAAGAGRRRPSRATVVCGVCCSIFLSSLFVLSSLFFTPRFFSPSLFIYGFISHHPHHRLHDSSPRAASCVVWLKSFALHYLRIPVHYSCRHRPVGTHLSPFFLWPLQPRKGPLATLNHQHQPASLKCPPTPTKSTTQNLSVKSPKLAIAPKQALQRLYLVHSPVQPTTAAFVCRIRTASPPLRRTHPPTSKQLFLRLRCTRFRPKNKKASRPISPPRSIPPRTPPPHPRGTCHEPHPPHWDLAALLHPHASSPATHLSFAHGCYSHLFRIQSRLRLLSEVARLAGPNSEGVTSHVASTHNTRVSCTILWTDPNIHPMV